MQLNLSEKLQWIADSSVLMMPEVVLCLGIFLLLVLGLFKKIKFFVFQIVTILILVSCAAIVLTYWPTAPSMLFSGMLRLDDFSSYFKILFCFAGVITVLITPSRMQLRFQSEYFFLLLAVVLGAHVLVMSMSFVMVILSLEMISIPSYVLAGFSFSKKASEGSLKYFLFGSASTAVMIYGISLLFGLTGTLDFAGREFVDQLLKSHSPLLLVGGLLVLAGFLFKTTAVPFHIWAPDVYESAPTPIVAFFSTVPKLAGLGGLIKFTLAINLFGQSTVNWQIILAAIAFLSLLVGNFSALWQKDAKRLMAYSSIAQAGFLLIGLVSLSPEGTHFLLFYATIFLISNFLTFMYIQQFESVTSGAPIHTLAGYGKTAFLPSLFVSIGLISLTGLPPTAGFTAKLLVFSSLWTTYGASGKMILLGLFAFGLINTVVSLFFYLKIPFYLFLKDSLPVPQVKIKSSLLENLLGAILVVLVLLLFFQPDLLMGWINRINFVL